MLGNFSCFCCHLLTFFKTNFLEKNQKHFKSIKSLDQDQDRHSVCPDLGPNCLQRLSVYKNVTTSKERVKNSHADVSSRVRRLNFGPSLYLHPYFVYVSSEGSGKSTHLCCLC